ncbi:MAG: oxygen-independent coproporphyrinogen-3 oxidase [Pseudoalteromonas rhizosphaerae]|jgi:oxygen-independent coproporphyrinogen-3 oxidase|uniref:Coproporphyrinogen-III oxidase n=1 Tax=Pseudoalteromonas neustonica TaxID=1840331 RepID=A0ABY3FCU0_9GAMM|nr:MULTISPECIES: oxygen-independent coproporphyrinogen III oxidase [Pseudoalteromonas]MBB1301830.1 oxygen-independent coproporphyrinogen III oxidase [Pseudoalteromonas sp. SR44-8]MBB1310439.1 oxygen-independent coproporphyrinogen III oxidase [Pseudoalteromonas sp. SR41-8]MBB1398032.1 oxygen-independent coproporphyrinogen III oxidase [Pseudoalteromonas sp. SG44-8]MBB1506743.1 oxygen-independent coproporphyrinogen III oxidase [Pseudoalteromonas sp. SG41-1]TVU82846.1 oxygen-independent coproporph
MINLPKWDQSLINKYNVSGPRYTSYPTALSFNDGYQQQDLISAINSSNSRSLSLYIHIPFCSQLCYYCGCNKVITRHQSKADLYLDYLEKEIIAQALLFDSYQVQQLHLGGGTPTFLTTSQMSRLIALLELHFKFAPDAERGIEIDPRSLATDMLSHLRSLGFNRVSFGIQDFNDDVQLAVNRPQSADAVKSLIGEARELGFKSINADMIYGLPLQTPESFKETIEQLIALSPDRVSVFNYAHLPDRFAAQRKIKDADLPSAHDKLTMFKNTLEQMSNAGYQFIGMDHFAKTSNELAIAQNSQQLHRNFQGYTTHGDCDLLGLGVSSISQIGTAILQNQKELKHYYHAIDNQLGSAISKGMKLDNDDVIRADVIKQLICHFELNMQSIANSYQLDFKDYFASSLQALEPLIADGMVTINADLITVTARGNLFIRIICMCFDAHLQKQINATRFSRVI